MSTLARDSTQRLSIAGLGAENGAENGAPAGFIFEPTGTHLALGALGFFALGLLASRAGLVPHLPAPRPNDEETG